MNKHKPVNPNYWAKIVVQYMVGLAVLLIAIDFIEPIFPGVSETLMVSAVRAAEYVPFLVLMFALLYIGHEAISLGRYIGNKLFTLSNIIKDKEEQENED